VKESKGMFASNIQKHTMNRIFYNPKSPTCHMQNQVPNTSQKGSFKRSMDKESGCSEITRM